MTDPWVWLIAVPVGYLIGAVPIGVLAGRLLGGVDVRAHGSGSAGATNVARSVGMKVGLVVLGLDIGKGVLVVFLARILGDSTVQEAVAGTFVVIGHNWPVFAGFRGGKGVATGLGALGVISPYAGLATIVGPLVTGLTRYVSLGSLLATGASFVVLMVQLFVLDYADLGYLIFAFGAIVLIAARHRSNMVRLWRGEESKFGTRVELRGAPAGQR